MGKQTKPAGTQLTLDLYENVTLIRLSTYSVPEITTYSKAYIVYFVEQNHLESLGDAGQMIYGTGVASRPII